jgi:hypothetical protein
MPKKTITYEIETAVPEWATPTVIKTMRDEGKSWRKIGELLGVSRETARQILLKDKPAIQ